MKLLPITAALLLAAAPLHAEQIAGDVSIVSKSQEAKPLAQVEVAAYPAITLAEILRGRSEDRTTALAILESLDGVESLPDARRSEVLRAFFGEEPEANRSKAAQVKGLKHYAHSADFFLSDLPAPTASTKTNEKGNFTLDVPADDYVLVSRAIREAGGQAEHYTWVVRARVGDKAVHLTNENNAESGHGSMVTLLPPDADSTSTIKGRGRDWYISTLRAGRAALIKELQAMEAEQFKKNPALAQKLAGERYPELLVKGSPFNTEFLKRHEAYKATQPRFFDDPRWPLILADECAETLRPK